MAIALAPVSEIITAAMSDLGFVRTAQRVPVLDAINRTERFLANLGSMLYLDRRTTLALNTADNDTAAPDDYGYGKNAKIIDPRSTLNNPELSYLPPGEFDQIGNSPTGNAIETNRPAYWTFSFVGASPAKMIVFAPSNTTGGTITYTFQYQRRVELLADSGSSFSLVPPGWEMTLLLDSAVWLIKDHLHWPISQRFEDRLDGQMAAFLSEQMVSKPDAGTQADIGIRRALRGAR